MNTRTIPNEPYVTVSDVVEEMILDDGIDLDDCDLNELLVAFDNTTIACLTDRMVNWKYY